MRYILSSREDQNNYIQNWLENFPYKLNNPTISSLSEMYVETLL